MSAQVRFMFTDFRKWLAARLSAAADGLDPDRVELAQRRRNVFLHLYSNLVEARSLLEFSRSIDRCHFPSSKRSDVRRVCQDSAIVIERADKLETDVLRADLISRGILNESRA